MAIKDFSASLKGKAAQQVSQDVQQLLNRFVEQSVKSFQSGPFKKAASVITRGKAGREQLSEKFRTMGEKQGRTALVLTEDDIIDIFKAYNIVSNTKPMVAYMKFLATNYPQYLARHYEIYFNDGTVLDKAYFLRSKKKISQVINEFTQDQLENIIAIRGLNFSHKNTLTHVAHFLEYIGAFPGQSRKEIEKTLSGSFDRGHIYAQTYGRALVSLGDLKEEDNILNQIVELYGLLDEGTTSLNRLDGKYNEILARAKKDFTENSLRMNIQIQAIVQNRESGSISQAIQIVSFLQKLIQNSNLSSDGKRLVTKPAATTVKEFEKALLEFDKKLEKYNEQLTAILKTTRDPDYLLKLRTSDSINEFLPAIVDDIMQGKGSKRTIKVNTPNIKVGQSKNFSAKITSAKKTGQPIIQQLKQELKTVKSRITKPKNVKITGSTTKSSVTNLTGLADLFNSNLVRVVKENMGNGTRRDILNLRTGRFAESVKVENLTESRAGMITAFYSYMKNPYATFSEGGRQQYPRSRDPKLLISKSIRELAAQQAITRLRAVVI